MKRKSMDLMTKEKHNLDKQDNMTCAEYHNFRTAEARAEYFAALEVREKRWPISSENCFIETSWAKTFVRISGAVDSPSLVLMHGMAGNSLSWEPNIKALSECFRTYAIDNPYDIGGRSTYIRDVRTIDDYISWMDETFTMLGLRDNINIVGMSYGAWLTVNYMMRHPEHLAKSVLLSPALVVQNVRFIWVLRLILSMFNQHFSHSFARWMSKDAYTKGPYYKQLAEDVASEAFMMSKKCISRRMLPPTRLKDEEWKRIVTPMLILAGEHEKIYNPEKAIMHIKRVAQQVKMKAIVGAGHDLPITQFEIVNQMILDFLKQ
jgi:pimeloyl-ACP methyl ester carboxylesterase